MTQLINVDAMEDLNIILEHSLEKYFKVLKRTGYKSSKDVYNLLSLVIITELLDKYSEYITEEDLRSISMALSCISGSCLIAAPTISLEDSIFHEVKRVLGVRISQESTTRKTEDGIFRIET